jgi:ketosteroid isomerase-like protein
MRAPVYSVLLLGILPLACSSPRPRERLLAADSAHAAAVATAGIAEGFSRYLSADAVYLEPDTEYIQGSDRIKAFLAAHHAAAELRFGPARADVSGDGNVGYTIGWTMLASAGSPARHGKYIAFWRKQPDGSWKIEVWNRSRAQDGPPGALPALAEWGGAHSSRAIDVAGETRALLGVDSAFAATSVAHGAPRAFSTYASPNGVSLGGGKDFVVGREAIGAEQAGPPGQVLDWKPILGGIGPGGDLGWTIGHFVFTPAGAPGHPFEGKYLTIWQRAEAASWLFVADGGSGSSPPNPAPTQP